jgi:hypothetical protein
MSGETGRPEPVRNGPDETGGFDRSPETTAMSDTARPAHDPDQPETQVTTYYATFDWQDYEPISSTVVSTVARAADSSPDELEELYERVEPGALDQLFESLRTGSRPTDGHVTFEYAGFDVTVYSYGQVVVRPPGSRRP